uniref:C2H2-type domain-containing protein n=1 Tax=Caenorhabditis japonica TaxID=281687 RepID=A0A8R1HYD8_CAEJA
MADEETTEFLESVGDGDEIEQNVEEVANDEEMMQVEHEEVLEEIVHAEEVVYDADGRIIEYDNMMMYEDGSEVIEEYVEVEDLGNDQFAYVVVDEHGNRRLLKPDEVEAVKKMEEESGMAPAPAEAPSSSTDYLRPPKRSRQPKQVPQPITMRDLIKQGVIYAGGQYNEYPPKRMNDMAKVDVEKYVPAVPINRRPLPDNADFSKPKPPRSRKNAPWQEETVSVPSVPSTSRISPSPIVKDPLFPEEEDLVVKFKCPECTEGFSSMDRHCDHMMKSHDVQALIREVDFFHDRDFESFIAKVEKATLHKEFPNQNAAAAAKKKSRQGSTQTFVCNYMNKARGKNAEFAEVSLTALSERPQEFCCAFIQKTYTYDCIRVSYCDQHCHYDGNIGYRVPLTVKRRIFELSFKRLPIPCMQLLLAHEAENLLTHPTRFEQKLKNFSHVELIELLGSIGSLIRRNNTIHQKSKKIALKFDTVTTSQGQDTLIVRRLNPPPPPPKNAEKGADDGANGDGFQVDGEEVPLMARETPEQQEADLEPEKEEGSDGLMEENMLYDPENRKDALIEELTEVELGVLDAYEKDIGIKLEDEQKQLRNRHKLKYQLAKVTTIYQALDAATHAFAPSDIHNDSIQSLREMASYVVEIVCQIDAEVKAQFNPALRADEIKRDMIAGIAMQERTCQPERRRRPATVHSQQFEQLLVEAQRPQSHASSHQEYNEPAYEAKPRPPFDLSAEQRHIEMLRQQHLQQQQILSGEQVPVEQMPVEQKPNVFMPDLPEAMKGVAYTKPTRRRQSGSANPNPNAPPKKRGRPVLQKAAEVAPEDVPSALDTLAAIVAPELETEESLELSHQNPLSVDTGTEQEDAGKSDAEPSSPLTPTNATKTRTGRVVKPKKWAAE